MAKPNPAPWYYENVQQPCDKSAYGVVKDTNGKILFDTLNSDVAEIHMEADGEGGVYRWDEVGKANLTLAAAAPQLLAMCVMARQILGFMRSSGTAGLDVALEDLDKVIARTRPGGAS